jgi:hypothetical protein
LFFSGAADGQLGKQARPAPLKNKEKEGWLRWCYKQATPDGV